MTPTAFAAPSANPKTGTSLAAQLVETCERQPPIARCDARVAFPNMWLADKACVIAGAPQAADQMPRPGGLCARVRSAIQLRLLGDAAECWQDEPLLLDRRPRLCESCPGQDLERCGGCRGSTPAASRARKMVHHGVFQAPPAARPQARPTGGQIATPPFHSRGSFPVRS